MMYSPEGLLLLPYQIENRSQCEICLPMFNGDFRDWSDVGYHCTPANITWTRNRWGQAPYFNGTDSYILDPAGRKILREGTTGNWSLVKFGGDIKVIGEGTQLFINNGSTLPPALTGQFSSDWADNIPNLRRLAFQLNSFSGSFPTYEWPDLEQLLCNSNSLSGHFLAYSWPNLTSLYCQFNSFTSFDFSDFSGTSCAALSARGNSMNQAAVSDVVDDLYPIRAILGGNTCDIKLQDNAIPTADAIAKIEGTGVYVGDGLKDHGCTVSYDT